MAYDAELAERVLGALGAHKDIDAKAIEEKAMFGGLSYMVDGAMCVGVLGEKIVARVSPDDSDRYLAEPGVRPMDFTGKPMKGWLYAEGPAVATDAALARWVDRCVAFVKSKPAKKPAAKKSKPTLAGKK